MFSMVPQVVVSCVISLFRDQVWFNEMCMGAKMTRGGLVVVNFVCQLVWAKCPGVWPHIILDGSVRMLLDEINSYISGL